MPRKIGWLDFAHQLRKEREAIQDRLPAGVVCYLTLADYGCGAAEFNVHLRHRELDLSGSGTASTPAKALEAAKADLKQKHAERAKRPQLVTGAKTLPPAKDGA